MSFGVQAKEFSTLASRLAVARYGRPGMARPPYGCHNDYGCPPLRIGVGATRAVPATTTSSNLPSEVIP